MIELSPVSKRRLSMGVHPALVAVVYRAAEMCKMQFMVVEGVRPLERQKELFRLGKSRTMNSRHLTGHAVDLAPLIDLDNDGDLDVSWNLKDFRPIIDTVKRAAVELSTPIVCGIDWKTFLDAPHVELDRRIYP